MKLTRIEIEFIPKNNMLKPYEHPYPYVFRGVMMNWLREIKPELLHELHKYEEIRPYSINSIIKTDVPRVIFILTSFNENLSKTIIDYFKDKYGKLLNFGEKSYILSRIEVRVIYLQDIIKKAKSISSFSIKFITPTSFNTRISSYSILYPLPSVLFGNLANLWNNISGNDGRIDKDNFINWINSHLYMSYYDLKTVKRNVGESKAYIGVIGIANYKTTKINKFYYQKLKENKAKENLKIVPKDDYKENCRWIDILCKLGEYTSVGMKRTAGMGVIKYNFQKELNFK